MKSSLIILIGVGLICLVGLYPALPVAANPPQQAVYFTPTPRPDGRIIYIVKSNDTCISISLLNNIPEGTLRSLNDLKGTDCVIRVGQELLLGMAGPGVTPSAGPSPTPTPILPTPTPFAGNGAVCVVLFNDLNGNGLAEDTEVDMAGGEVSLTDTKGKISLTGTTVIVNDPTVDLPLCFNDIPEGSYNVSVAVPQGYNPTTSTSRSFSVMAGSTSTIDFGAQVSLRAADPTIPVEPPRSPLLGILGGSLILAGAGLAFWLRRSSKSQ